MWIQVRSMDGSQKCIRVDGLSKLTKIEELRARLIEPFDAAPERQRFFYRGKQLEDGHTLFDYDVGLNDIVQIMIRPIENNTVKSEALVEDPQEACSSDEGSSSNKENEETENNAENDASRIISSSYYRVGDLVDAKVREMGAWFEGKIIRITKRPSASSAKEQRDKSATGDMQIGSNKASKPEAIIIGAYVPNTLADDGLLYYVSLDGYEDDDPEEVSINEIRPRARNKVNFSDIEIDDMLMVNYNIEEPKKRGYWYDCKVTSKKNDDTIIATVFMGSDGAPFDKCKIVFVDEVFRIEKAVKLSLSDSEPSTSVASPTKRSVKPRCDRCNDVTTRKCKYCACHVCGGKDQPGKQILCDECDMAYHIWCLNPPLAELPEDDEWYCPECKNDTSEVVKAGEKLKESKRKSKMASSTNNTSRDWGKGMACVGRTKECTIVPPNHWGPIPGVDVGMMWKFRVQVSEFGVHRPHVAGIHGRNEEGAYSIVLSGGYEDDLDKGDEFMYTGSGGRDLSGNKRTAEQSCDQTLTRTNKALACNCAAPLNSVSGAEAKNWKEGKPVRVVRNCKGAKHSKYSPEDGNRYDGIYKVVKYWPEKGKSGFLVWRYLLRRDDPTPAPWTKVGKKRIQGLGYVIQYPEGYVEEDSSSQNEKKKPSKRASEDTDSPINKKAKSKYKLSPEVSGLIKEDKVNSKLWEQCQEHLPEGQQRFLKEVEEVFACICCQELLFKPVSTLCQHNICKACLGRSFKAEVYNCPMCRHDLGKNYEISVNTHLADILVRLFPGYETGR